jgi:hypothetical protein
MGGVYSWRYPKEEHPRREEIKEEPTGSWLCLVFPGARNVTKLSCLIAFALIVDIIKEKRLSSKSFFRPGSAFTAV